MDCLYFILAEFIDKLFFLNVLLALKRKRNFPWKKYKTLEKFEELNVETKMETFKDLYFYIQYVNFILIAFLLTKNKLFINFYTLIYL
jgi:hypothetical protein